MDDAGNNHADDPDEEDRQGSDPERGPPVEGAALLEEFRFGPLHDQGEDYPDDDNGDDYQE